MSNINDWETWQLQQDTLIELYQIDLAPIGINNKFHFCSDKYSSGAAITFKGNSYNPLPIESGGYESSQKAPFPSPTMKISNVMGSVSALLLLYDDLAGAKVTRIRVFAKYLGDAAAPELPREIYYVERIVDENEFNITIQLVSGVTLNNATLPARKITRRCPWAYRGSDCGYSDLRFYTENDQQTFNPKEDVCSKSVKACKLRFGNTAQLNHGGFASIDR